MHNDTKDQSNSDRFQNCDSIYIFQQVRRSLTSGSSRSLWLRIESEMERAGVGGADTYLSSVFSELIQEANGIIDRFRETTKPGGE